MTAHLDARLEQTASRTSGNAEVVLHGDPLELAAAVTSVSGRTLGSVSDAVTAVVPAKRLRALAGRPGVQAVAPSVRAHPLDTSEGVHLTHADAWQGATSPITGSGVKVGIVDVGFKDLGTEVAAGNLPAGLTVAGDYCPDVSGTDHGTGVAEIVHQMAPGAKLFLYCITDDNTFEQAEAALQAAGVKIVNSSLAFPGDGRGDGTGPAHSSSSTVRTARQNGILWIQAAGNSADDHWAGSFADSNPKNGIADLSPSGEDDAIGIGPGGGTIVLQWDKWPTSTLPITLNAQQYADGRFIGSPVSTTQPSSGAPPVLCLEYPVVPGDGCRGLPGPGNYDITITIPTSALNVHYDLSYWGDVTGNYLSCGSWSGSTCLGPSARAQSGSISEPATSPYAFAVGAVDARPGTGPCEVDQNTGASYPVEEFSSRGPTIDGRIKPDIAAFDNVSSNLSDLNPFCGTSAAAPHVAGAAALVEAANTAMDPAQIQEFLERRAGASSPNNQVGHGVLNLGSPSGISPPTSYGYRALTTPQRVVSGYSLGAGQSHAFTIPTSAVPTGAAAVVFNMTAVDKTSTPSYVSLFTANSTWMDTSSLYVSSTDVQTEVLAVAALNGRAVQVRNSAGTVLVYLDVLGYFGGSDATSKYTSVPGVRLLNTTTTLGNHQRKLNNGETMLIDAGSSVPPSATAVAVNVMAYRPTGAGYLTASVGAPGVSTLRYINRSRANLAITPLSQHQFRLSLAGTPSDAVVDLVGYFGGTGASFVPLPAPVRVVSTRTGNGIPPAPLGATTKPVQGARIFDVPYTAKALVSTAWALPVSGGTYLTVYPDAVRPPQVSTMAFSPGQNVSNAVVTGLNPAGQTKIENTNGSVHVALDLAGYFI
jgi:hypothetical protein